MQKSWGINMRDYFKDKNTLSIPWVESPFFYSLLENSDHTEEVKEMCRYYHENGYLIIDLNLTDEEIQPIVDDMYKSLEDENTIFHAEHYQYTESKRIFELWKESDSIAKLCVNKKVMDVLDTFTVIVLAFGAGMVTHRVLWKFFDWVLDAMERMDDGEL